MVCQTGLEVLLIEWPSLEEWQDWSERMGRGWQTWAAHRDDRPVVGLLEGRRASLLKIRISQMALLWGSREAFLPGELMGESTRATLGLRNGF